MLINPGPGPLTGRRAVGEPEAQVQGFTVASPGTVQVGRPLACGHPAPAGPSLSESDCPSLRTDARHQHRDSDYPTAGGGPARAREPASDSE